MTTDHNTARRVDTLELPVLMNITEVAAHLGVTVRHVRRLVAERRIPFIKWGHLLRFDPTQIVSWLSSQNKPVAGVPPTGYLARDRRATTDR